MPVKLFRYYPLSILIVLTVTYLSLFNPDNTSLGKMILWDKAVHVIMYMGVSMVFWFEHLISHKNIRLLPALLINILFASLLGGLLELIQEYFTVVRSGDWADFMADAIGTVIGAAIGILIERPLIQRLFLRPRNDRGDG